MDKRPSNQYPAGGPEPNPSIEGSVFIASDGTKKILRRRHPLLQVENLSVVLGGNTILRNINLTIRRGETIAIIGESGCGKTVFLKNMIGLIAPSEGRVLFDGKDIATLSDKELTETRTRYGFVFQMAALFDSLTISENVAFPLRQHRKEMRGREIDERVRSLLVEVGLNPDVVWNKTPSELSGGMRKRVGFARALAMEPDIMLYDEPTTGLDPIMSDVVNQLMIHARDKLHVAAALVTHDMKSARSVADRLVMLYPNSRLRPDEPQIIFDGTPDEIERCGDKRVLQFVRGEAGDRMREL